MYPTVISFYTNNWEYPKYAHDMMKSCDKLGLEHYIVEKEDTGNYLKNTRIKPQFILEALNFLQTPVLWIDVDGSILRRPELFKEDYSYDFAARKMAKHRDRTWHVGTMYFKYNDNVLKFVERWATLALDKKASDELILDQMWRADDSTLHGLRIDSLPEPYFEMLRQLNQTPKSSTIICHRASKSESKLAMKKRHKKLGDTKSKKIY